MTNKTNTNLISSEPVSPYSEQFKEAGRRELSRLIQFLKKEPALVITGSYLGLCLVGLAYLSELFRHFKINVFSHLELSDFILGAIHYPSTLLVFAAFIGILIVLTKLEFFMLRRFSAYQRSMSRYYKVLNKLSPLKLCLLVMFIYLVVAAQVQARINYEDIIEASQPGYDAQLSTGVEISGQLQKKLTGVRLVANLSKYMWLYHPDSKRVFMITHESLLLLAPIKLQKETPAVLPKDITSHAQSLKTNEKSDEETAISNSLSGVNGADGQNHNE